MVSAHLLLSCSATMSYGRAPPCTRRPPERRRTRVGSLLEVMNGCQPEGAPHVLHVTEEQVFLLTPELLFIFTQRRFKGLLCFKR